MLPVALIVEEVRQVQIQPDAQRFLRQRDIGARARAINKAIGILSELSRSLNYEADLQLSRNLAALYNYIVRRLIEANLTQTEKPLAEAEALLATLAEAWKACVPPAPESSFLPSDPYLADPYLANDPYLADAYIQDSSVSAR